ncbi:hypothetical protein ACPDHL_04120 [Myroides sp. C15-4]
MKTSFTDKIGIGVGVVVNLVLNILRMGILLVVVLGNNLIYLLRKARRRK